MNPRLDFTTEVSNVDLGAWGKRRLKLDLKFELKRINLPLDENKQVPPAQYEIILYTYFVSIIHEDGKSSFVDKELLTGTFWFQNLVDEHVKQIQAITKWSRA